ncbi:MAG: hypothetical protein ABL931_11215 [Usitatibacteraceae bacterium]
MIRRVHNISTKENSAMRRLAHPFVAALFCSVGIGANAWVLVVTPGARTVYLGVGNSTTNAPNATINRVSVAVPAAVVGTGVAQAMTSNSTQANSPFDNFVVCTPPNQVYIGGYFREPSTTANVARLQVTTPATLTSGADTLPFSQISWTSTALGNATADIPAGTFNGASLFLRNIASNTYVENCHTFTYANANLVAAGVYNGRATYTLSNP